MLNLTWLVICNSVLYIAMCQVEEYIMFQFIKGPTSGVVYWEKENKVLKGPSGILATYLGSWKQGLVHWIGSRNLWH